MTLEYPIDDDVLDILSSFPKIKNKLHNKLKGKRRSKLEIVRALNNHHVPHIEKLLFFIEQYLDSTGEVGMTVLNEADPFAFSQRLAEFYLLVSLQSREGVNASPSSSKSGPNPDINIETETAKAKIEIYSPVDVFGFQYIQLYSKHVFRYSQYTRGFNIALKLIVDDQTGYHAYDVPREHKKLRLWLNGLRIDVDNWIADSKAGDSREFDGLSNSFKLKATIVEVFDNPEIRIVEFSQPGRSDDPRLFFEGSPRRNAKNQMGLKICSKLKQRQCGPPNPEFLRILILNFRLTDCGYTDWFCLPYIVKNIDQSIRFMVEKVGAPSPFDVVIPAMLDYCCSFGEPIVLDDQKESQINELMVQTGLDKKFALRVDDPPPDLIEALKGHKK